MRPEGFYNNEKSTDTSWDRTSDLPHLKHCATAVPMQISSSRYIFVAKIVGY